MKRWSTSFAFRKLEVKITKRYYYKSIRMGKFCFKKLTISDLGQDVEQEEFSCISDGNSNGTATLENPWQFIYLFFTKITLLYHSTQQKY